MFIKAIFSLLCFFSASLGFARVLQVPEDCVNLKKAPCLMQVQDHDEKVKINQVQLNIYSDTIIKWISFENEISVELIKGRMLFKKKQDFLVNGILFSNEFAMLQRNGDVDSNLMESLDLHSFLVSTYILSDKKNQTVLKENQFLDKVDFVKFVARFYKSRNKFKDFLTKIEPSWKKQFNTQAETQTKVLKRSLASAEEVRDRRNEEIQNRQNKFKKVREQFFYRTFYR
ncbi:MAG: hypothetical protein WA160_03720 [Pseudobdellovibrio sp.]